MMRGAIVDMSLYIGKQFNDLLILDKISGEIKSKIIVSCKCLLCGNISNYKFCEVVDGYRKRCQSCNIDLKLVKRECIICNGTFEQRNMVDSKRTGGYTCRLCYSNFTKSKCKEFDEIVDTSNGNHSGYCEKHWSFHRIAYSMVQSSKCRAKKSGYPFDLDIEWVKERLNVCSVTGIPFEIRDAKLPPSKKNYSNRHPYTPTIDKIVPEKGYLKDNCRLVCWWYNLSKSIYTDEFTMETISKWIKNKEQDWQTLLNMNLVQTVEVKTT